MVWQSRPPVKMPGFQILVPFSSPGYSIFNLSSTNPPENKMEDGLTALAPHLQ